MNCDQLIGYAKGYLEGTLAPSEMEVVRAHEASCKACRDILRERRKMSCADFIAFLDDYVSETLPSAQRQVFERHIGICPECVTYLESYRTTIALARAVECGSATDKPRSMPEGLVRAILAARLSAQESQDSRPG